MNQVSTMNLISGWRAVYTGAMRGDTMWMRWAAHGSFVSWHLLGVYLKRIPLHLRRTHHALRGGLHFHLDALCPDCGQTLPDWLPPDTIQSLPKRCFAIRIWISDGPIHCCCFLMTPCLEHTHYTASPHRIRFWGVHCQWVSQINVRQVSKRN